MVWRYDTPLSIEDNDFPSLLGAPIPVMMLFWEDFWHLAPINDDLIRIARDKAGQLIIAKINSHKSRDGRKMFNINSSPLLLGLRDGNELPRMVVRHRSLLDSYANFILEEGPLPKTESNPQTEVAQRKPAKPENITDANFEQEILHSPIPVIVNFWASWCEPCQMIAPFIRKLAQDYEGIIRVIKVDVDSNPYFAGIYGVQSIPTIMLFNKGKVVARFSEVSINETIDELINKQLFGL